MLIQATNKAIKLHLNRNLVRNIKRGHPWVYADALRELPKSPAGSKAILYRQKQVVAQGFYDPDSPLAFRVCQTSPKASLNDAWARVSLRQAIAQRQQIASPDTNAYRLINGEGDGLPGLICDIYDDTAILNLDGAGPAGFWAVEGIAQFLADQLGLVRVYLRARRNDNQSSVALVGSAPDRPILVQENGVKFWVDVASGQKTGFFLDQRDNRQVLRALVQDKSVLNLFAYTGGFSVYAGLGGAKRVTSVDLAAPAIALSEENWAVNGLSPAKHQAIAIDAFDFLTQAQQNKDRWDVIIIDPPSFAPSAGSVPAARKAYQTLLAGGASLLNPGGLLVAASCSSHIDEPLFLDICQEAVSQARRKARVWRVHNQPADHPWPLACPELRYLNFVVMAVDA